MRFSLALPALLLAIVSLSACRSGPMPRRGVSAPPVVSKPATPVPKPAPAPAPKPKTPAELANCLRPDAGHSWRFVDRKTLRTGGSVCVYTKPDLMLAESPPFGTRYKELQPLAVSGNAEAQFRLAVIVNPCTNTPDTPETLKSVIAAALKSRRYLGGTRVEDPKLFDKQMRQEYADCDGVNPAQRGRSREWARSAADAGFLDAQEALMYMARPGNVFYSWNKDSKDNNARDTTHYKAVMDGLIAARSAGSVEAMLTLGSRYAQGSADNPPWERAYYDPLKSYANFVAYDQVQQAIGGKRRPAIKGTMVGDMQAKLSTAQRSEAEAMAKTMLANPRCCVVTQ